MTAPISPPPEGTVERFAFDYIRTTDLAFKLTPGLAPTSWEDAPLPRRIDEPARPPCLHVARKAAKTPRKGALVDPRKRAQILHTFFHHELQAAELMAWALLAFPHTPRAFRVGLLSILDDEARHARLYQKNIERIGFQLGDFEVRDWFWERVPKARDEVEFTAVFGMGFEAANLDHAPRFASWFRAAGDEESALAQELIAEEERSHVAFALHWYSRWTGGAHFEPWIAHLPPPISPLVLRGDPIDLAARARAGFPEEFLDSLVRWQPARGSLISTASTSSPRGTATRRRRPCANARSRSDL